MTIEGVVGLQPAGLVTREEGVRSHSFLEKFVRDRKETGSSWREGWMAVESPWQQ